MAKLRTAIRPYIHTNANSPPVTTLDLSAKIGLGPDIDGNAPDGGLRLVDGKLMVGNMELKDLPKMTEAEADIFIKSFPEETQKNIIAAVNNFVDVDTRTKARALSQPLVDRKTDNYTHIENQTITNGAVEQNGVLRFMKLAFPFVKYGVILITFAGVTASATQVIRDFINAQIDENSGCFLKSSDGELIKLNSDPANCNCTTNAQYRQLCCEKCKAAGDASTLCPGEEANDLWTDPYVCPPPPAPTTPSARSRSSISTNASVALARAEALARPRNVKVAAAASSGKSCVSCGCKAEIKWELCTVQLNLWDILADLASDAGGSIVELGDGTIGFVTAFTSKILKPVLISVGSVMGVAFAVGIGILIARLLKKKKPRQLTLG